MSPPVDSDTLVSGQASTEVALAAERGAIALKEVIEADPNRSLLGASNVVVSGMLILGALMIVTRRKTTMWWCRQALIANMVWTALHTLSQVWQLSSGGQRLKETFGDELRLRAAEMNVQEELATSGEGILLSVAIVVGLFGALRILGYFWMLWRLQRSDIQAYMQVSDDLD
jgi:hypothetical protein